MPEVARSRRTLLPRTDALRARFLAWWDGRPPADLRAVGPGRPPQKAAPAPDVETAAPPAETNRFWTAARIELAQSIWGREHVTPAGEDHIATLLKPLALDPSMSVMEIGAGLGAATRMMHKRFGAWPKSFEPDADLAATGMFLSTAAGLAKKAPVLHAGLAGIDIRANGFDRIILRDVIHRAPDKAELLRGAAVGLRRRGQLLVTDLVLSGADGAGSPDAAAWSAGEPGPAAPWTEADLKAGIAACGLSVHIAEDESAGLRSRILDGWAAFQARLVAERPGPATMLLALQEGERWRRCVAAIDAGALRHFRIIASKS
ncbi:MAG: hypothetical protein ACK4QW_02745 [Alphaproteobacteria bacterium]